MKYLLAFVLLFITLQTNSQVSDFKNINFNKADNNAKKSKGRNLQNLPLLTYDLTSNLKTDVEKFRAIYKWICSNVKGDYNMHRKVRRKRNKYKNDSNSFLKWNKEYSKTVFKSLLEDKKTMCTGYAYLLKTMTSIANVDCKIINGYGRNNSANIGKLSIPNHSWNAVFLNNKWYLVDATWASGYTDLNKNKFIFDYNDGYFLTEPKLFVKNHLPLNKKWMLLENKITTAKEFLNAPLIYSKIIKHKITPVLPKKMENKISKNEEITFALKASESIDLSKFKVQTSLTRTVKPISILRKKDSILILHKFKIKGFYDVHILYKNDVIVTYTFNVQK
ncbi:MAG: transglutaminase domain-containing protein [Polaribacter sp.]|uniref:transglutaminase domain-containing protein n=1 Tax=Polaribacter sp. TaxID=1920175 RepID=UPI002F3546D3